MEIWNDIFFFSHDNSHNYLDSTTVQMHRCTLNVFTIPGGTTETEKPSTFGRVTKPTLTSASAESTALASILQLRATATLVRQLFRTTAVPTKL